MKRAEELVPLEQTNPTLSGGAQPHPLQPAPRDQLLSLRNVVMATDFSECSEQALSYAVGIAARYGAQLWLFHCVDPTPYNVVTPDAVQPACEAAWRDVERLESDLQSKGLTRNVKVKLLVEAGDVAEILPRMVSDLDLGLIVVGTHGRTGWKKLVLGSVAEVVVDQASCPVLTVGPCSDRERLQKFGPENILLASDRSTPCKLAESYAFSLARKYECGLTVAEVVEDHAGRVRAQVSQFEYRDQAWRGPQLKGSLLEEKMIAQLPSEFGTRSDLILRVADRIAADLIVLTVPGVHKFSERFIATDSYQVVCGAACPVLTVRAQ